MINKISIRIRNSMEHRVPVSIIKITSFLISLLGCLLLGSVLIFPLISQLLIEEIGLKIFDVNLISSFTVIGMYLCLPVLGYLSDVYGNNLLSIISIFAFCPAYFSNYFVILDSQHKLLWLCINYCLIGLGTSALYFLCLLTCSKIYPEKKGLSISLPVTSYGISSLISTQILKLAFFKDESNHLNILKIFVFFGFLYLVLGILNFLSTSIIIERSFKLAENTELIPISSIEPPNHQQKFLNFLRDPKMYVLLASLFLILGPLETFQNNLNSLLGLVGHPEELNSQIILLSLFSTITRLVVGILSDYMNKRDILITLLVLGTASHLLSYLNLQLSTLTIITIFNGITYGGVFTIYPTILAEIWSVEMLGSTWGLFMIAPAISTSLFSLLYGNLLDTFGNLSIYSRICSLGTFISIILVITVRNAKTVQN